jgi:hypothetical protein
MITMGEHGEHNSDKEKELSARRLKRAKRFAEAARAGKGTSIYSPTEERGNIIPFKPKPDNNPPR